MTERSIFLAALDIPDPDERAAYLDAACGDNGPLRRRIDELIAAEATLGSFLNGPHPDDKPTDKFEPLVERPGVEIGPYKLLQVIGEGGMGVVYMAEQSQPVQRRVALKVVKPGLDSKEVIARFEAERQALAMMDHLNIAKVLDAGATSIGRPYFVMELVHGIPITRYCDENCLSPLERLTLFIPVCLAVQHAHQKGIIHRDIKPSNVLVCLYDGKPVPKVIDFGVAKAIEQRLTKRTVFTHFGSIIGTFEYMSPEQAEMSQLGVDTRSDIYSLGVLLYELLTGSTPLDRQRLRVAALDELLRMIRTEEPPKPSTRISQSGHSLRGPASSRSMDSAKLARLVRGDLDWIVMKCLDKDRTRRYETASGLARDIQRFLTDEAIEARPPSALYRLTKFARRNRVAFVAGTVVAASLLAGLGASTTLAVYALDQREIAEAARKNETARAQAETKQRRRAEAAETAARANERRATVERDRAEHEKNVALAVKDFLQTRLLKQADATEQARVLLRIGRPAAEIRDNPTIRELLDRAAAELTPERIETQFPQLPLVQAEILRTIGNSYFGVGDYTAAAAHLERAYELQKSHLGETDRETLGTLEFLGRANAYLGDYARSLTIAMQVHAALTEKWGGDDSQTLQAAINMATANRELGILRDDIARSEELLQRVEARHPQLDALVWTAHLNLAQAYVTSWEWVKAEKILQTLREKQEAKLGAGHPTTFLTLHDLAMCQRSNGRLRQAIEMLENLRTAAATALGPTHPRVLIMECKLAVAYREAGQVADAIRLFERVRNEQVARLGPDHEDTLGTLGSLALAYRDDGRRQEALLLIERVHVQRARLLGPEHPTTVETLDQLAGACFWGNQLARAVELFEQVRDLRTASLGAGHLKTLAALHNLALAYQRVGRLPEAITLLQHVRDENSQRLGDDHPYTLHAWHYLAEAQLQAAKSPLALQELRFVFEKRMVRLGADHIETLRTLDSLAFAHREAGELPAAIRRYEQLRDLEITKFGPEHYRPVLTLSRLAYAHVLNQQPGEAIRIYEQARDQQFPRIEFRHPDALLILTEFAGVNRQAGRYDEAIKLYERARGLQIDLNGADDPATLSTLRSLAGAYRFAGKHNEALKLYEEVRERQAAQLGPEHPDTLTTTNDLGVAYYSLGRNAEAILLFEQLRIQRIKVLGSNHPSTLTTLTNLAAAYVRAGRHEDAILVHEQVRDQQVAQLGSDAEATLTNLNYLGLAYRNAGRFDDAVRVLEQVYEQRIKKQGPDNRQTLVAGSNLGGAYLGAKRFEDAIRVLERTHERRLATIGAEHLDTLNSMQSLASAYRVSGGISQAIAICERNRALIATQLGADHPNAIQFLDGLADAYRQAERLAEAREIYEDIVPRAQRVWGTEHPTTTDIIRNSCTVLELSGEYERAAKPLRELLANQHQRLPSSTLQISSTTAQLGRVLIRANQFGEAEPLLIAGYERMRASDLQRNESYNSRLDELVRCLIDLYMSWDKPAEAAKWQQALHEQSPQKNGKRSAP